MLLLQQMIVLFILMLLGYFLKRKNIIDSETSKKLSAIVINIANPALILSGSINRQEPVQINELVMTMGIAILLFAALIVISIVIIPVLRVPKQSAGVYKIMTIFSNIGFMGFPVIDALYGNEALLYASLFLVPYNLLIYTYGIYAMNNKNQGNEKTAIPWKKMLNIGVVSCIISILICVMQIQMPEFIKTIVSSLSNLTAPLSMMVIGASIEIMDLKKIFTDKRILIFSIIKLLVIPIVGVLILKQVMHNEVILGICMVMLSTPVGSMVAMLAQQYEGDYELASKGVIITTVLSIITMPIVSILVM